MKTVASFGGGVNSTAMLIGIVRHHPELRPDAILFADTGGEKPETYDHRDEFSRWLVSHGLPAIVTVASHRGTLEQECLDNNTLPSIVIGLRSCSDVFKIRPQQKWQKDNFPGEHILTLVGFDAGEPWRAKNYDTEERTTRYPLIEWGWDREECVEAIQAEDMECPPKSSCFFCPEMREWEILDLRDKHPDLFSRALEMEANNSSLVTIKGLAQVYSWKQIADYDAAQLKLLPIRPDRKPCTCVDGGE